MKCKSWPQRLADQLIEIMPELVDVDSWPAVGPRRSLDDVSALEQRSVPESVFDRVQIADVGRRLVSHHLN